LINQRIKELRLDPTTQLQKEKEERKVHDDLRKENEASSHPSGGGEILYYDVAKAKLEEKNANKVRIEELDPEE
jgi:hypothetical protein